MTSTKNTSRRPIAQRIHAASRGPIAREDRPPLDGVSPAEEVARYIADMTIQLASMASGARLDLLAYFLNMAHAESIVVARPPTDPLRS